MPFILTILANLFGALIGVATRKGVISAATVTAFVVVTAAFIVCMKAFLGYVIAVLLMPPWLVSFIGMFIPSNLLACVSAIFSARSCKFAYRLAMAKINAINSAV